MINGKRVLCVIPARAGSVGIKDKNLKLIHGKSLIGWAATIANAIEFIDVVVVSTDSTVIAEEAKRNGGMFLGLRPFELSGPAVHDQQVLLDSLGKSQIAENCEFEIVVMLQPTSPLRSKEEVEKCIHEVAFQNKTACWTVSKIDPKFHFRKQLSIDENSLLRMSIEGPRVVARQELSQTYFRNGACYVFSRETIQNDPYLMGNSCGYVISEGRRPNIDVIEDLVIASEISCINQETGLLEEEIVKS